MVGGTTESQKIFSRAHHSRCLAASLCCCDFRLGRAPHSTGSQSHTDRGVHSRAQGQSLLDLNVTELKQWQQLLSLPFYASPLTRLPLFSAAPHMIKSNFTVICTLQAMYQSVPRHTNVFLHHTLYLNLIYVLVLP